MRPDQEKVARALVACGQGASSKAIANRAADGRDVSATLRVLEKAGIVERVSPWPPGVRFAVANVVRWSITDAGRAELGDGA